MTGIVLRFGILVAAINAALITCMVGIGTGGSHHKQLMFEGWNHDNADVYLMDVYRGLLRNLTSHPAQDIHPIWSPDGRWIAFESVRENGRRIYIMDAQGRNLRRLTTQTEISEADPAWSADSKQVFFRGLRQWTSAVYSVNIDSGEMHRLNVATVPRLVNTDRIVSMSYRQGNWGIYVTNAQRTDTYRLTDNNVTFSETPHWSSDNRQIAFISRTHRFYSQIYAVNADGSGFRQITFDKTLKINLSWRPD